ncbi:hypothetical protein SB861_14690 [Paraburkholderia sp. SIMBA_049]
MNQQTEAKRGPGRPRKIRTPEPLEPTVANTGTPAPLRVCFKKDIAKKIERSIMTVDRLIKKDSDFPASFALSGYENCWLEEDIDAYLRLKARRAQEAKLARLANGVKREG